MTTTRRDPIASSSSSSSSPPPDLYENKATKPAEHGKSASVPNLDDRDEKPDAVEPQGTLPTPPVRRKIQITDSNESRNPDNILDVDDDYGIHYKSQSTIRFVIDANKSVLELLEGECRRAANTLDVDEGTDALTSPEGLGAWLRERQLLGERERVGADDLALARRLRDGLRVELQTHHGTPPDDEHAEDSSTDHQRETASVG